MTKRRLAAEPRRYWTAEEDALLRARFPHEPTAVVAVAIGRPLSSVCGHAYALGLNKTAEYLAK